mmetsp:Transcript_13584/g.38200  ORF Transcript_13584/g.38200 Transcript_13584/m.38200 type:complete len:216 (-) Transcript_13584:86-733(-)
MLLSNFDLVILRENDSFYTQPPLASTFPLLSSPLLPTLQERRVVVFACVCPQASTQTQTQTLPSGTGPLRGPAHYFFGTLGCGKSLSLSPMLVALVRTPFSLNALIVLVVCMLSFHFSLSAMLFGGLFSFPFFVLATLPCLLGGFTLPLAFFPFLNKCFCGMLSLLSPQPLSLSLSLSLSEGSPATLNAPSPSLAHGTKSNATRGDASVVVWTRR